ncbi:hypothetical protein OP063_004512 [Salmonella enterica subsp. enterica]|uniref:hypothetical protein n=1 Tax=Salmonella enterica TaxID=28901 RepID=UPI001590F577|nr:hypothetical protein [Salmonella enterica]EEP8162894.1 hypothetical protein [Salmonella enterica subsp. enterica serovar Poona]EHF1609746.1 hypothetical protein [Salmonella enterica subsp. enterica serovar Muenchen]EKC4582553.1 hypothetical protein [Salmonella enterica subsp. enterica]QVB78808.1 hypothetical protein JYM78_23745 [Salmonella enterica subsp. enterica serovar Rubislaw]EEX0088485.1 hypothetical protein [Salmonella enterica]
MASPECRRLYRRHGESGASVYGCSKRDVDVATAGMETRCPEGAGPGQRSRPGAKHDSPVSRQGSRPASAKTDTEYQQQEDAEKDRVHQK